jgi:hypothetical protein
MRPLLIAAALLLASAAAAATPLLLVERQVITLEFSRPVARVSTTDPDLLALEPAGSRLRVAAVRAGRAQLDVAFEDGASATFDVTVEAVRRAPGQPPPVPGELLLSVGEARRLPAPGLERVLVEENGVARVEAVPGAAVVTAVRPGRSSVVLIDGAGTRTTVPIRVRP